MSFSPGDRCGPYEIVDRLGQGGMGEVFRARDARLGRSVAIKVLPADVARDRQRLDRFEQEARATGALNHPNVLSVYDIGTTADGIPFIVSELLEGETLRERLNAGPIPRSKVLDFALQITRGLAAAHQRGIVHRDLKPENLFITGDGRLKILDFGLAKLLDQSVDADAPTRPVMQHTEPGLVLGTVGYMSPEQVRGRAIDHRSDIFSFGAVLLEMYSGVRAFRAESTVETLNAILSVDPQGFSAGLPEGVESVVRRCLEKNPGDRFQSAQDLSFALEALAGPSKAAIVSEAKDLAAGGISRKRVVIATAALLLLAIAAFVATRFRPTTPPRKGVSFEQLSFRLGTITAARFASDPQTILYSAAWEGRPIDVFTTRRNASESRSLGMPSTGLLAVSANEELALSRDCSITWGQCAEGTLARVSLAGGAPREMLANVAAADWSPDGKTLAIVRAVEGKYRLEFPPGNVLYTTEGWITSPRFASDGKRIAFCDHPILGSAAGNVGVVDLQGRVQVVSRDWRVLVGMAWSPADKEIWISASRKSVGVNLYAVDMKGNERALYIAPATLQIFDVAKNGDVLFARSDPRTRMLLQSSDGKHEIELSWLDWSTAADISADAKSVLFYEWGAGTRGNPKIYLRHTDGSDAVQLGEGKALALSRDGVWALALNASGTELSVLPTGAGEKRVLPRGDAKVYYSAAWFPDGVSVLFVAEGADRAPATFRQSIAGGPPQRVGPLGWRGVVISPDGKQAAGYGADGQIERVSFVDGASAKIAGAEPSDTLMEWSSDGSSLFAREAAYQTVPIVKIDLESGKRSPLTEIVLSDPVGFIGFESDGVKITPDGQTCVYSYWRLLGELFVAEGLDR